MGWLAWMLVGMLGWMPLAGYAAEYTIGPVPAWVVPVAPGVSDAAQASKGSDGVAYLLTDTQVLAGEHTRERYHRNVSVALNASGVDSIANIQIPFDPSYQTLVLHSINIVRHGQVIPKLATAKVRVIQRETELETRIYDGAKTANVFLDDVRAGDTIDYAYSTIGRNPVFKDADFGTLSLQYATPVARIHQRLLVPLGKHVVLAARHTAVKPVMTEHDGLRDYVWDVIDSPALTVESGAPSGYWPFAEISWSEYPDWAAVARWAMPLYQVPATLSPELQAEVTRIAKAEATPTGRMLAALRLVQAEVRYLGVEIGQNSHAPNPPALVFARRFGDCKDKTLLTLTLLGHLGIEAHAALVNTTVQRGVLDALPNPGAFDHVLVQAHADGKTWWIDPTRFIQQADIAHLPQPDFGVALIVSPHTQALTAMQRAAPASSSRHLDVVFDIRAGFDKPVRYTVTTTTSGEAAETLRATLTSTNLDDVQKNYLNFYASAYPHIAVAAPLKVEDDKTGNRITTTETYLITGISSPSADGKKSAVDIDRPDIEQLLRDPSVTIRKAPLQLAYPMDVSQRTEVLLSEEWSIEPDSSRVENPAFRFEQTVSLEGSRLILTDHYQALTDEVAAPDMPRYLEDLAHARSGIGYQLTQANPPAASAVSTAPASAASPASKASNASGLDRMNWPVALLALMLFGLWTWLATVAYRYDPSPRRRHDNRLAGIDGWLILLIILLMCRPYALGKRLIGLAKFMSIDQWSMLTTYGSSTYHPLWAPILLFRLVSDSLQLVLALLVLVLFIQRRSSFPRMAVLMLLSTLVLNLADQLLGNLLPAIKVEAKKIHLFEVAAALWIAWSAYLLLSRRVQATFVKRYRVEEPPPLPFAVAATNAGAAMGGVAGEPE